MPTTRPLGSVDKCERCGKEYTVESGRQKYCPDCQREAVLEWQRDHKAGYNKKNRNKEKETRKTYQADDNLQILPTTIQSK